MTKAEHRERVRYWLDQLGTQWLKEATSGRYDIDEALMTSLRRFCRETKCMGVTYVLPATAERGVYGFGAFGVEAADTDVLSVLAAADNTTAFTLVSGQPSSTYIDRHYITVSLKNASSTDPDTGLAANYTVTGTLYGGIPYSEVLSFAVVADLTGIALGGVVTKTTTRPFATVTSITPSAAQDAGWQHSAGVGAQTAGTRIFEIAHVEYNDTPLTRKTRDQLDKIHRKWRSESSGTPAYWYPEREQVFGIWRKPSGTDNLRIEAYEYIDSNLYNADANELDLDEYDQEAIPIFAAILGSIRNPSSENQIRQSQLFPMAQERWLSAFNRIHGGDEEIVFGRNADISTGDWPTISDTITNLS